MYPYDRCAPLPLLSYSSFSTFWVAIYLGRKLDVLQKYCLHLYTVKPLITFNRWCSNLYCVLTPKPQTTSFLSTKELQHLPLFESHGWSVKNHLGMEKCVVTSSRKYITSDQMHEVQYQKIIATDLIFNQHR